MRTPALVLALILATPAHAACRHYSKWSYPYPQPACEEGSRRRVGLNARTTNPDDRSWYVEIAKLPDDVERAVAIDRLKEALPPK